MTVHVTAVPNVIDALLTKFRGLSVAITDAEGNVLPKTPIVFDGLPVAGLDDVIVSVGGGPDPTGESHQTWGALGQPGSVGGAPARDETAIIRCYASSYVGGADEDGAASPNDAQKAARDNAYAIVKAAEVSLRNDPQLLGLGGAAVGVPLLGTGWISVTTGTLHQTKDTDPNASIGRVATVEFFVEYFSRLYSI